jgi:hypothetical protein
MAGPRPDSAAFVRNDAAGGGAAGHLADELSGAGVHPPEPGGGHVVVTRFECPNLAVLLYLLLLHARVRRDASRQASGLIASRAAVLWRRRTLFSITLWRNLDSIYTIGSVPRHTAATRLPRRFGVSTSSGVFTFTGDARRVLFGSPVESRSPLLPLTRDDRQKEAT